MTDPVISSKVRWHVETPRLQVLYITQDFEAGETMQFDPQKKLLPKIQLFIKLSFMVGSLEPSPLFFCSSQ